MDTNEARFFIVAIRATTERKLSETEQQDRHTEKTTYRLPSLIRNRLKSWRVKRHYHFRRFGGIHWKTLHVWFFPVSERPRLERWLSDYRAQYYEICRAIPDEDDRKQFEFKAEWGEFVPIQPEASRIIARMVRETIKEIRHDVDRVRANLEDLPSFIESVKQKEEEIATVKPDLHATDPTFSWSNESIMMFANILAMSTQKGIDRAVLRRLKTNITKLIGIISPFSQQFNVILELVHDSLVQVG